MGQGEGVPAASEEDDARGENPASQLTSQWLNRLVPRPVPFYNSSPSSSSAVPRSHALPRTLNSNLSGPPHHNNTTHSLASSSSNQPPSKLVWSLTGWRRKCLFVLLIVLSTIVVTNLALTLWLLRSMQFSLEGIGNLRIVAGGVQLNGEAMFMDSLVTSSIRSRKGSSIALESSHNVTLTTRDANGRVSNRLYLGEDKLEVLAKDFRITNAQKETLFAANKHEVVVGADTLRVTGEGGAVFSGSVQTPVVRAQPGNDLRLESTTRSLQVTAPLGIALESRAGDVIVSCLGDMKLSSTGSSIRLDSSSITMPNLKTAVATSRITQHASPDSVLPPGSNTYVPSTGNIGAGSTGSSRSSVAVQVFQLCACSSGRLFLAPADAFCVADTSVCT